MDMTFFSISRSLKRSYIRACVRKPLKYNRVFCIGNLNRKLVSEFLEYSVPTLKIPSKKEFKS